MSRLCPRCLRGEFSVLPKVVLRRLCTVSSAKLFLSAFGNRNLSFFIPALRITRKIRDEAKYQPVRGLLLPAESGLIMAHTASAGFVDFEKLAEKKNNFVNKSGEAAFVAAARAVFNFFHALAASITHTVPVIVIMRNNRNNVLYKLLFRS